jgi:hypothetical protein
MGQFVEVNAVIESLESKRNPAMDKAFAAQAIPDSHVSQQINRVLLENAGSHPFLHIFASPRLQNNGLDALQVQQVR